VNITSAKLSGIGLALAAFAAATGAFAGSVDHAQVQISFLGIQGTFAGARYSLDPYQEIGCTVWANPGGSPGAYCWATDAARNYAACLTSDPSLVAIVSTITPVSWIDIGVNTTTGACTSITVQNRSGGLP
jgi:hypothetical protein